RSFFFLGKIPIFEWDDTGNLPHFTIGGPLHIPYKAVFQELFVFRYSTTNKSDGTYNIILIEKIIEFCFKFFFQSELFVAMILFFVILALLFFVNFSLSFFFRLLFCVFT